MKILSASFWSFELAPSPAQQQSAVPDRAGPAGSVRVPWLDIAKALAIGLVVFGHASRSVERTDGMIWSEPLRLADVLIYSFHIPFFFALAGLAAALQRNSGVLVKLHGFLWGIIVPYIVWTLVWGGLKLAFPGQANTPLAVSDLMHALWVPIEHLWFLQHLLIARLLWLALQMSGIDQSRLAGSAAIGLMLLACVLLAPLDGPWHTIGVILGNAGLFGLGFVWGTTLMTYRNRRWTAVAAAALAVVWVTAALGLEPKDTSLAGIAVAIAGVLTMSLILQRLSSPITSTDRGVAFLGEASLAIYVIHPIVIGAVRAVLDKAGLLSEPSLVLAGTLFGILVPAAMYWLLLGLAQRTRWPLVRWTGLGTATRSHYVPVLGALVPAAPPSKS